MGYLVIDNFGDGLDSRRSQLTTKAGALITCKNAHITRGKEIEKRKAFVPIYTLPTGAFGLHAAGGLLYVFGSQDISSQVPSGITYQRLRHPSGDTIEMSEIVFTESFNGLPYVIATYNNGDTLHFFNGSVVSSWDTVAGSVATNSAVADSLATQIDSFEQFSASANGPVITITGTVNEPFLLSLSAVNGGTNNDQSLTQTTTQAATASLPQITQVTVSGTFEAADRFSISATIPSTGFSRLFSVSASSAGVARTVKTFGQKMYGATKSLLYFSEIANPTKWGGTTSGAGFINLLNQDSGAENLTALAVYQGRLAVFSERTIQVWGMDADPSKNIQIQTLNNIGTFAPKSVVAFGDVDVFFLSESGVRSIRARDSSNAATVSDIGTAIDTIIQRELENFEDSQRRNAVGIIEPSDGRYWLALGTKIYVFSFFTGSAVSAWSTYDLGFQIDSMTYLNSRIFIRSENKIYIYGGQNGNEYDDSEVVIEFPFLDGGKPAHTKSIQAIDMAAEGAWDVFIGTDHTAPEYKDFVGTFQNSTYALGRMLCFSIGTHVSFKLINNQAGAARIGNFAIHFDTGQPE
jgi:hypothetical protein